jgi:hypothetical protein
MIVMVYEIRKRNSPGVTEATSMAWKMKIIDINNKHKAS